MNEIERAIELISTGEIDYSGVFDPAINKDVETIILEALREKAEREKGCEYCSQSSKSIDNGEVGVSKAILYLCAKSKRIHFMDAKGKLAIFDIKYCPMCGKRLEVEHE